MPTCQDAAGAAFCGFLRVSLHPETANGRGLHAIVMPLLFSKSSVEKRFSRYHVTLLTTISFKPFMGLRYIDRCILYDRNSP